MQIRRENNSLKQTMTCDISKIWYVDFENPNQTFTNTMQTFANPVPAAFRSL